MLIFYPSPLFVENWTISGPPLETMPMALVREPRHT